MTESGAVIGVDDAAQRIIADLEPLPQEWTKVGQAYGRTLAVSVESRSGSPPDPVSVMDGIAIDGDASQPGDVLKIIGESAAGRPAPQDVFVAAGLAVRISTGAVLPEGANAVVPREELEDTGRQVRLAASRSIEAGQWVRAPNSDIAPGQPLLGPGHCIAPGDVALLASAGHDAVLVHRVPRVAIICTGDELVEPGERLERGKVVGTNHLMLGEQVRRFGGHPIVLPVARDDLDATTAALRKGVGFDLLLTSGGISVGEHDHVAPALQALGLEQRFGKLALRPGRPTSWFVGPRGRACLALPGNPASSLVAMQLLGRAAIRTLCGARPEQATVPYRPLELGADVRRLASRAQFMRARLRPGTWLADPLHEQRSGALTSIANFDVLLEVPAGEGEMRAGTLVRGVLMSRP